MGDKMIFQLGTNNWQRQGEFAPGSGILHEALHYGFRDDLPGVHSCWSIYPSVKQTPESPDYEVFHLEHDMPICEGSSPVSCFRWHTMSNEEFDAYRVRLENTVYEYMEKVEAQEGRMFSYVLAHHSFLNPIVMRNVIRRRVKEAGKADIPLFCFVHGTALQMFINELAGDNQVEFPLRFHAMLDREGIFGGGGQKPAVDGIFVISNDQFERVNNVFPTFPKDRMLVTPNGVNQSIFHPMETTSLLQTVLDACPSKAVSFRRILGNCDSAVIFCGYFAGCKRIGALLQAASKYEAELPRTATLIVGSGPPDVVAKYQDMAHKELSLKRCLFLGPQTHDVLARLFSASSVGVFPTYKEAFGLVFIEAMACGTPVIGADSGGPRDFVTPEVGELVPEPGPDALEELSESLNDAVTRAIKENHKVTKRAACLKLASEYSVKAQCKKLIDGMDKLSANEDSTNGDTNGRTNDHTNDHTNGHTNGNTNGNSV